MANLRHLHGTVVTADVVYEELKLVADELYLVVTDGEVWRARQLAGNLRTLARYLDQIAREND